MNLRENLLAKIKVLNETIWEDRANNNKIKDWLNNFENEEEKLHAIYILSQFMYFCSLQMRFLLKSLYRDLYKYRIVERIRKKHANTIDFDLINLLFEEEQKKTRFLGIGNPSESGVHLLYFFRQENKVSKKLFINTDEVFDRSDPNNVKLNFPDVEEYVFIDDFCGSGSQAKKYSKRIIEELKSIKPDVAACYLMLFSTKEGKKVVKNNTKFDIVDSLFELDETFKCFSPNSRYFNDCPVEVDQGFARSMCEKHGYKLIKSVIKKELRNSISDDELEKSSHFNKLGFSDNQLLIGFHHNTPDNSLPIIWYDEDEIPWKPIFKRYNKKYGL